MFRFKKLSRRGEAERATRGLDVFLTDYCTSIFAEHVAIFSAGITRFMWSDACLNPFQMTSSDFYIGMPSQLSEQHRSIHYVISYLSRL